MRSLVPRLTGSATKVGQGWIVQIPSRRLWVRVAQLADVDETVTGAVVQSSDDELRVQLDRFLVLEDRPPATQRELTALAETASGVRVDDVLGT